jgi:hypothetical protein
MKTLLLILLSSQLAALDFNDFDSYQMTREEIERRITSYLEKDPKVRDYFQISDETFSIGDPGSTPDYIFRFAQETKQEKRPIGSLKGARIAIDPGHFGGPYARLEERFVSIDGKGFDEGTLTYLTARKLTSLLEAQGATVMITRDGIGKGAIEQPFFAWLQRQPDLWGGKETLSQLFRIYYNREDLYARASKINAFSPDITLIIHYNAHQDDKEKDQNLTQTNFNVTFVPGAFTQNELKSTEERYEFVRLLLSDAVDQSIDLSRAMIAAFTSRLNTPPVSDTENPSYISKMCLKQSDGVYARNLALTRIVHSPLCYGETLIQNNEAEFLKLSTTDASIDGIPCSSRLIEVAEAYFEGLRTYFEGRKSSP